MPTKKNLPANPAHLPHLISPERFRRLLCVGRVRFARALQAGQLPHPVEIAGRLVFRLRDVAPLLVRAGLSHLLPPDLAAAAGEDVAADDSA